MVQMVKNLPAMQETRVQSLGWEGPLEKEMATHFCILVWRIPWTEKSTVYGITKSRTWLRDWHFHILSNTCSGIFVVVVQLLSHIWLLATLWTVACQVSLSVTISRSLLKLMSLSWWCHPTILSFVVPFSSCLQSFPASGSFSMSRLFASSGQSIMNIQGWFPLGLTGCPRESQESSAGTQFESISYLALSLPYGQGTGLLEKT